MCAFPERRGQPFRKPGGFGGNRGGRPDGRPGGMGRHPNRGFERRDPSTPAKRVVEVPSGPLKAEKIFDGVFRIDGKLATINANPGVSVYGEKLITIDGVEYRFWEPFRSKIGASLAKGLGTFAIKPGSKVLYLGAANGTTVSHVSDIVGPTGAVYAVEFSARSMRDLLKLCEKRENIFPILADARNPQFYAEDVGGPESVDVVFEDVADRAQARIMIDNSLAMLKKGGVGYLAVKSRSIDQRAPPFVVFNAVEKELLPYFVVIQSLSLEPFEADHAYFALGKK